MKKQQIKYLGFGLFLVILLVVRMLYGFDVPMSGDEAGVSVVQAVGQWDVYDDNLVCNQPVRMNEIKKFITYSSDYSVWDVITTMRNDKLHPPLYFILLHFQMWLFGNSTIALRGLSAIFSILSVLSIFLLGKTLYNETVGWISVFFISISPYCLEYSIMVRPYPLVAFISIFSSYLIVLLIKSGGFNYRHILTYIYILISVAGLYTFYNYFFIIAFQFLFVLLTTRRDLRSFMGIALSYLVIFMLFIPWIMPLLEGIGVSQVKSNYFNGTYTLLFFFQHFFDSNIFLAQYFFTTPSAGVLSAIILILSGCIIIVFLTGIVKSIKIQHSSAFVASVLAYFLLIFMTDKILITKSLVIDKQQYFIVPVLLFLLAVAIYYLTVSKRLRLVIFSITSLLLFSGFCYRVYDKSFFDGPFYAKQLDMKIQEVSKNRKDDEVLVLYNTDAKRFLLPFIHETKRNFDIMVLPKGVTPADLEKVQLNRYKQIMVVNIAIHDNGFIRSKWVEFNKQDYEPYLLKSGYYCPHPPFSYTRFQTATLTTFVASGG